MVEEELDEAHRVVALEGLVERSPAPATQAVRIGTVLQEPRDPFIVMPVVLAGQHGHKTIGIDLATLDQHFQRRVVVSLRSMVRGLAVVRICPVVEQETGELGVPGHAGSAIDDRLEAGIGLVILRVEAGVRACTVLEQKPGCANEPVGARSIEAQVARKAEVGERIPIVELSCRRRLLRIAFDETSDRRLVAENRRDENIMLGNVGVLRKDGGGPIEGPRVCDEPSIGADAASTKAVTGSSRLIVSTLCLSFDQESNPYSRATMSWASARRSFSGAAAARGKTNRMRSATSAAPTLASARSSLACFFSCSTLARAGSCFLMFMTNPLSVEPDVRRTGRKKVETGYSAIQVSSALSADGWLPWRAVKLRVASSGRLASSGRVRVRPWSRVERPNGGTRAAWNAHPYTERWPPFMADGRQIEISEVDGSTSCMHLRGTWRLADGLPSEADLDRDVRTASAVQRLRFDTSALTGWDSSLVTFLVGLIDAVRQRGVDVDCTSLPEGVQRLLALVDVTPETMAHPGPQPSWLARVGNATRARVALDGSNVGVPGGSNARFRPASPGPCSAPAIRSLPRDSRGWRTCAADRHADQRVDWDDLGLRRRRHPAQLRRHHLRGRSRCHSAGARAWRHHDGDHHGRSNRLRLCGGAGIDARFAGDRCARHDGDRADRIHGAQPPSGARP